MFKQRSYSRVWVGLFLGLLFGFAPLVAQATPAFLSRATDSSFASLASQYQARAYSLGGHLRIKSSFTTSPTSPRAPVSPRQVVDGGAVILSLPALIVDFVPLLGNIVALSSGQGRFGWSLSGIGFSLVGVLLMLPTFSAPGVALALGIVQAALLGISLTNLILALQERAARRSQRSRLTDALSHQHHQHASMRFGF